MKVEIFAEARACLEEGNLDKKIKLSSRLAKKIATGCLELQGHAASTLSIGRPHRPVLVPPSKLPRRGFSSESQRLAMAHAIAHIEFNAINLAWDAIWRFQNMPEEYYRDWAKVAEDETRHFNLLRAYLLKRRCDYGDFEAHDGLWTMAERTAHDVLDRMAIVPRVLEARGLDVTPAMIGKFKDAGDLEMTDILTTIYEEEIEHVRIGNKWYSTLCHERGLEPASTFINLIQNYGVGDRNSVINEQARRSAGFSVKEIQAIQGLQSNGLKESP